MSKQAKSLNERINELDRRVEWFYSEDFELEKAVWNYREATELAKEIEMDLKKLKNEVEVLAEDFTKE